MDRLETKKLDNLLKAQQYLYSSMDRLETR